MTYKTGLTLLREPFPAHQISKLPKPTKRQTEEVKSDFRKGIRCPICGAWHHPDVVHLDYVGHAALTSRLLDVDEKWNWEPLAYDSHGAPFLDKDGGMWIKLTVCGTTRLGYGAPGDGKSGPDAIKETIGDALRNAAMRFGAALDLWHKGDLNPDSDENGERKPEPKERPAHTNTQRATEDKAPMKTSDPLPPYPEDKFLENLPKWCESINAGKLTSEKCIKRISNFYTLTEEQENVIREITPQAEPQT